MRIFTDYHHSSLLRSLQLLFEDRMGHELFRPIGKSWFTEGYWKINDLEDTAKQFLSFDQSYKPSDGTPPLNRFADISKIPEGYYFCENPGADSYHKACTLDYFKNNKFDILIASIPQHIEPFKELIRLYQPQAKLIIQVGNNWNIEQWPGHNVLASIMPRDVPGVNVIFYHQEIDLNFYTKTDVIPNKNIYSFVNIQQNTGACWDEFLELERMMPEYSFKSYGGQCRDGSMHGDRQLSDRMRESMLIYHCKPGGDGFGHVLHNAYAIGRPVIARYSQYKDMLGGMLLIPGTFIDMDQHNLNELKEIIENLSNNPDSLKAMGNLARDRFEQIVRYNDEKEAIEKWLENLL